MQIRSGLALECGDVLIGGEGRSTAPMNLDRGQLFLWHDVGVGSIFDDPPDWESIGATGSVRMFTSEFRATVGDELIRIADELVGHLGRDETESFERSA